MSYFKNNPHQCLLFFNNDNPQCNYKTQQQQQHLNHHQQRQRFFFQCYKTTLFLFVYLSTIHNKQQHNLFAMATSNICNTTSPSSSCYQQQQQQQQKNQDELVLNEIQSHLSSTSTTLSSSSPPFFFPNNDKYTFTIPSYNFFQSIAYSDTFRTKYWRIRPLLIPSSSLTTTTTSTKSSSWVTNIFTMKDLQTIDGSFISGQQTSLEIRKGSKGGDDDVKRWRNNKNIKDNPQRRTRWDDVVTALTGGTVFFNHASLSFPSLAHICRLATLAFGLPTNVNIYVTPPLVETSIPPHTDRQDVLIMQTAGSKRWRVWGPPKQGKPGVDPFNRGKNGDTITERELQSGKLLINAVLRPGDVLYVPAGFPHATDTSTVVVNESNDSVKMESTDIFSETSLHLTLGLDAHVWGLTYMHLRQFVLSRSGKDPALRRGATFTVSEEASWDITRTIPVGFLAGKKAGWDKTRNESCQNNDHFTPNATQMGSIENEYLEEFIDDLKKIIMRLEHHRWADEESKSKKEESTKDKDAVDSNNEMDYELVSSNAIQHKKAREPLPTHGQFLSVIEYILCQHLPSVLHAQEVMYSHVTDPRDDSMLLEMRKLSKKQNEIMQQFSAFGQERYEEDVQVEREEKNEVEEDFWHQFKTGWKS